MTQGVYLLAGHAVEITTVHDRVHAMCRAYRTDAPCTLRICTTEADITAERARGEDIAASDAYYETLAVYRKLTEALLARDVLLFHASAVAVDGAGYLFTAPSGTGKSTHTRLWRELLGDRVVMVNDDKPLLHVSERGVEVYGTPWAGKHGLHTKVHVPVRAICVLRQAPVNRIEPISPEEGLPMLLQQSYLPVEQSARMRAITLALRMGEAVSLWRMDCTPEPEAARMAFAAMAPQP